MIRRTVRELMLFDSEDSLSRNEAAQFLKHHEFGAWTVAAEGVRSVFEIGRVLQRYVNITQLTFSSHGCPGVVALPRGNVTARSLMFINVPQTLFEKEGKLLFMGCETARGPEGEAFLIAAGKHFFAGHGGIVGGATIGTVGLSSGTRLPIWDVPWLRTGALIVFRLDAKGRVIERRSVRPKLFGVF